MQLKITKIPWYLSWKGLLGTKEPRAVVFSTRFGIHTFGMQYPIDVVILDRKGYVVKQKEHLQPNRLFFWNPLYNLVLELPQGTIEKKRLRIGERIDLRSL